MRLLAPLLLAAFLVGCGDSDHNSDASANVEALIARQLPSKMRRVVGTIALVESVHCVHQAANSYECIASVSGPNAYTGIREKVQVPIAATCDDRACIWKLSP